ncbi:cupin domain-containing protein [Natrinema salaciae]|nr:cupin domain-containing protein [Natrinema salaciae]
MGDGNMEYESNIEPPFERLGDHEQHEWTSLPWDGVHNKVLYFDRATGMTLELAMVEEGAEFPQHYHTTAQTLFLVSGELESAETTITEGTFNFIPAGEKHGPYVAQEDSVQFKFFNATPTYILEDGDCFVYTYTGETLDAGTLEIENLGRENILVP